MAAHLPLATAYCVAFGSDPHNCTCPVLGAHIEVLQAPAWTADALKALACGTEPRQDRNATAERVARERRAAPRAWLPRAWAATQRAAASAGDTFGRLGSVARAMTRWLSLPPPLRAASDRGAAVDVGGAGHVTLVTVGWDVDYHGGHLDAMLHSWCGPKVRV